MQYLNVGFKNAIVSNTMVSGIQLDWLVHRLTQKLNFFVYYIKLTSMTL